MSFGPWLNICFLSIGDMQTQNKLLHWSQEVSFQADQSFKPGSWQKPQDKNYEDCCAESSLFTGVFVPQVVADLGALDLPLSRSVRMSKLCVASFSSACMHWAVNLKMHLRGEVEGVGLSNLVMLLSLLGIGRTSFGCFGSCLLTSNCVLYNILLL